MLSGFNSPKGHKQDARLQKFLWKTAEASARAFQNRKITLEIIVAERARHTSNDNQE